jgi:hypothetical protein
LGPQRDLRGTTGLARTFGGIYGLGLIYARTMLGPRASEALAKPLTVFDQGRNAIVRG